MEAAVEVRRIKEYLNGFGEMFHVIDAKLEEIVELLRDEEDDD
jgi:hypothetical protein